MKRSFIFFFHPQNFLREVLVGTGAAGKKVKIKNRFSETWRLGETHASGNNTVENFSRKMIFHFADNLIGKAVSPVEHGEEGSHHFEIGLEIVTDEVDRFKKLAEALKRVIFALNGNQHFIRRHQAVHCERTKTRRAIDDYIIIVSPDWSEY